MTRHAAVHREAGLEGENSSLALRASTPVGSLCKPFWLRPGPTETSLRQKSMAARHALVCNRIRASLEGRELGRRVTYGAPFRGFGPAQQQVVRAQQAPDSLCTPLPCSQGSSTCQSPLSLPDLGYHCLPETSETSTRLLPLDSPELPPLPERCSPTPCSPYSQ